MRGWFGDGGWRFSCCVPVRNVERWMLSMCVECARQMNMGREARDGAGSGMNENSRAREHRGMRSRAEALAYSAISRCLVGPDGGAQQVPRIPSPLLSSRRGAPRSASDGSSISLPVSRCAQAYSCRKHSYRHIRRLCSPFINPMHDARRRHRSRKLAHKSHEMGLS